MSLNKTQLRALRLIKERISYAKAGLHFSAEDRAMIAEQIGSHRYGDPHGGYADTEAIKRATRLYRETWIDPLIDALIAGDTALLRELCK